MFFFFCSTFYVRGAQLVRQTPVFMTALSASHLKQADKGQKCQKYLWHLMGNKSTRYFMCCLFCHHKPTEHLNWFEWHQIKVKMTSHSTNDSVTRRRFSFNNLSIDAFLTQFPLHSGLPGLLQSTPAVFKRSRIQHGRTKQSFNCSTVTLRHGIPSPVLFFVLGKEVGGQAQKLMQTPRREDQDTTFEVRAPTTATLRLSFHHLELQTGDGSSSTRKNFCDMAKRF